MKYFERVKIRLEQGIFLSQGNYLNGIFVEKWGEAISVCFRPTLDSGMVEIPMEFPKKEELYNLYLKKVSDIYNRKEQELLEKL